LDGAVDEIRESQAGAWNDVVVVVFVVPWEASGEVGDRWLAGGRARAAQQAVEAFSGFSRGTESILVCLVSKKMWVRVRKWLKFGFYIISRLMKT
jgi:hypothetical protein